MSTDEQQTREWIAREQAAGRLGPVHPSVALLMAKAARTAADFERTLAQVAADMARAEGTTLKAAAERLARAAASDDDRPMSDTCRHCGKPPEADGDHSCPCPNPDGLCPEHDIAPGDASELDPEVAP